VRTLYVVTESALFETVDNVAEFNERWEEVAVLLRDNMNDQYLDDVPRPLIVALLAHPTLPSSALLPGGLKLASLLNRGAHVSFIWKQGFGGDELTDITLPVRSHDEPKRKKSFPRATVMVVGNEYFGCWEEEAPGKLLREDLGLRPVADVHHLSIMDVISFGLEPIVENGCLKPEVDQVIELVYNDKDSIVPSPPHPIACMRS
jgi:hypothetical protein